MRARRNPDLARRLTSFTSSSVMPVAQAILVSEVLSQTAADRALLHAIRRGVGERRVMKLVQSLPGGSQNPQDRVGAIITIAQGYFDLDDNVLAENWAETAQKMESALEHPDPALVARISSILQTIKGGRLSSNFGEVI